VLDRDPTPVGAVSGRRLLSFAAGSCCSPQALYRRPPALSREPQALRMVAASEAGCTGLTRG